MTEDEFRAHVAALVEQTCGSTAALARKHKLHPKALTLFLSGARGPSAEVARAFGFERQYVSLVTASQRLDAATGEREGECTCQRYPTHQANDCSLHGLEPPFDGVPHDGAPAKRPQMTEAEARDMLLHNSDDTIIETMREWGFVCALATEPHQHGGKGA